jgi:3-isopropylmalate/(R)-2-methylmalate dehydratase small subunit
MNLRDMLNDIAEASPMGYDDPKTAEKPAIAPKVPKQTQGAERSAKAQGQRANEFNHGEFNKFMMKNKSIVTPFDKVNVDTDQIIPTEYLKSIKTGGFGDYLFDGWRYLDQGQLGMTLDDREVNKDFILNQKPYDEAKILLTRNNFGCGSSREHAVWALRDFGFQAVIASSFGDIFYNNCFKNGVLPLKLTKQEINSLFMLANDNPLSFEIDLKGKELKVNSDLIIPFKVDINLVNRIIHNLDDVDITLQDKALIKDFEINYKVNRPWIFIENNKT